MCRKQIIECRLCQTDAEFFYSGKIGKYYRCGKCLGISLSPDFFLSPSEEKARYETHHNDPQDSCYQKFVSPIVKEIERSFTKKAGGLDFGCGTGPVIQYLLNRKGFSVELFDPFFNNDPSVLTEKYDFIACCEVIEHFHNPAKEFALLFEILSEGGKLYCMTDFYNDDLDFGHWYYKNDNTHVFFYHKETVRYICRKFGFADYYINNRLAVLGKGTAAK